MYCQYTVFLPQLFSLSLGRQMKGIIPGHKQSLCLRQSYPEPLQRFYSAENCEAVKNCEAVSGWGMFPCVLGWTVCNTVRLWSLQRKLLKQPLVVHSLGNGTNLLVPLLSFIWESIIPAGILLVPWWGRWWLYKYPTHYPQLHNSIKTSRVFLVSRLWEDVRYTSTYYKSRNIILSMFTFKYTKNKKYWNTDLDVW